MSLLRSDADKVEDKESSGFLIQEFVFDYFL